MKRFRTRAATALTVIGLLAVSGVALAASDDDTVFNYGYDQDSQFFMWNVTSLDYSPNADALEEGLEDEESTADTEFEALLEACGLGTGVGGDPAEYGYTFDGNSIQVYGPTEGEFDPSDDPIESVSADCGEFDGGFVTGPEGQVNHGMFLKLFNEMYEGENRGCLVRHIARSDLGKDGQQVEADPDFEADETVEDGTVAFITTGADCVRGPERGEGDEALDEESERRGPPQFVKDKFGGDGPGKGNGGDRGDGPGNGKGKPEGTPGGRP